MIALPYITVCIMWLLSFTNVLWFGYIDAPLAVIILFGMYKSGCMNVLFLFGLGLISDIGYGTTLGVHPFLYMLGAFLGVSKSYEKYGESLFGYYMIIGRFLMFAYVIYGAERYVSYWDMGVFLESAIHMLYTISWIMMLDLYIAYRMRFKVLRWNH